MKIKTFRETTGITLAQMAGMLGLNPKTGARTVQRYEVMGQIPNRQMMQRIVTATNGQVQPNDFYEPTIIQAKPMPTPDRASKT